MKSFTKEQAVSLFWSKVRKDCACWEWTASTNKAGYGQFRSRTFFPGVILAHRIAFEISKGRKPIGVVRHSCDNPRCVRPDHLQEGTQSENISDMISRHRHAANKKAQNLPAGKNHHAYQKGGRSIDLKTAKLIRTEKGRQSDIAKKYGVSQTLVSRIRAGKVWAKADV